MIDSKQFVEMNMRLSNLEQLIRRIVEPDQWMDIKEAVKYANVSVSTFRRAYQIGALKYGRTKGKYLFKRSAIDSWLENVG